MFLLVASPWILEAIISLSLASFGTDANSSKLTIPSLSNSAIESLSSVLL